MGLLSVHALERVSRKTNEKSTHPMNRRPCHQGNKRVWSEIGPDHIL